MVGLSAKLVHSKRLRPIAAAVSLLALMALAGCGGGKVDIDAFDPAVLETPTPLVERLPITVGVHYDEELLNHYHREDWYGGLVEHEYRLGPPTKAVFDPLFPAMFEKAVPVESPSTTTVGGQKVPGVLSLTIESFVAPNMREVASQRFEDVGCRINYSMTLYAPPGVKKTVIRFHGEGAVDDSEVLGATRGAVATRAARAMRNAAAALVVRFYEDPEVMAWLASLGISEHGAEETSQ